LLTYPCGSLTDHALAEDVEQRGFLVVMNKYEDKGQLVLDQGTGLSESPFPGTIHQVSNATPREPNRFGSALALDGKGLFLESTFRGISGKAPRTVAMWLKLPQKTSPGGQTRSGFLGFPRGERSEWAARILA
jgi:hypothetical protein